MKAFKLGLCVCIGIFIGGASVWIYCRSLYAGYVVAPLYQGIVEEVSTLTLLQRGAYQELKMEKERALSGDVYAVLNAFTPDTLSDRQIHDLMMVVRYREKHPFRTDDGNIDLPVEKFLKAIQEKNKR